MDSFNHDFENLYLENYQQLYRLAFRMTGNPQDAEDALQEAFTSAYSSFSEFRHQSAVSTWLYRITMNSALKYIKQRKSFLVERLAKENGVTETEFFKGLTVFHPVEDEVLYNDMRETCIHMFTECLPIKQRLTFILRVFMNLSVYETSRVLEISESGVKTNLYRARDTLKKAMEGKCSLIDPNFPCQCKLWVNYAIENNKRGLIQSMPVVSRDEQEIKHRMLSEINFLKKLAVLYDSDYRMVSGEAFLSQVKKMLHQKSLKLFQ